MTVRYFYDDEGKFTCKDKYDGEKCDQCKQGFTGFPICVKEGNFLHLSKLSSQHVIQTVIEKQHLVTIYKIYLRIR